MQISSNHICQSHKFERKLEKVFQKMAIDIETIKTIKNQFPAKSFKNPIGHCSSLSTVVSLHWYEENAATFLWKSR